VEFTGAILQAAAIFLTAVGAIIAYLCEARRTRADTRRAAKEAEKAQERRRLQHLAEEQAVREAEIRQLHLASRTDSLRHQQREIIQPLLNCAQLHMYAVSARVTEEARFTLLERKKVAPTPPPRGETREVFLSSWTNAMHINGGIPEPVDMSTSLVPMGSGSVFTHATTSLDGLYTGVAQCVGGLWPPSYLKMVDEGWPLDGIAVRHRKFCEHTILPLIMRGEKIIEMHISWLSHLSWEKVGELYKGSLEKFPCNIKNNVRGFLFVIWQAHAGAWRAVMANWKKGIYDMAIPAVPYPIGIVKYLVALSKLVATEQESLLNRSTAPELHPIESVDVPKRCPF
jgi:hypothetical protein